MLLFRSTVDLPSQTGPSTFKDYPALFDHFKKHQSDAIKRLEEQSKNLVKLCQNKTCGKPCAVSLSYCNSCGHDLPQKLSTTTNVFFGFAFGVQKFGISIRSQDQSHVIFDDPLSLSRCHLNAINTEKYIPDFRYLLLEPKKGLELVHNLLSHLKKVIRDQFMSNETFMKKNFADLPPKYIGTSKDSLSAETVNEFVEKYVVLGVNCPPSQYLLHIQCFMLPLLPFQYQMYLEGKHATPERFFPIQYVLKVLERGLKPTKEVLGFDISLSTPPTMIIDRFAKEGIQYADIHKQEYAKIGEVQRTNGNWKEDDFQYLANVETKEVTAQDGSDVKDKDFQKLIKSDKDALQNYGRPYQLDAAGNETKPSLSYYKHPRDAPLESFP